jgi:membrane associated rhomboid family serine protease
MGFQDREYMRRDGPSFLGSFWERGKICKWLIGINVVVFFIQLATMSTGEERGFGMGSFTNFLDLNVQAVIHGQVWRLLTHFFLHDPGNPFHILFNMLFLWWFGSDMEDLYGPREFLAIYLVGGLTSGVAYIASTLLLDGHGDMLGASGAVFAVLLIFACHYPTRTIRLFFFLPVPIWLFVALELFYNAYVLVGRVSTGVAVAAHLGGAAFGFAYYKMHWRLSGLWPDFKKWRKRRSQPRLRVYREEPPTPVGVAASAPPTPPALEDEHLEAKMDAVLEKISREGKENLTESEKAILLKASEILRKRRS